MKVRTQLAVGAVLAALLAATYWLLHDSGTLKTIMQPAALHARVVAMGAWGPIVIVALMALAVVISPIPSAPIALAAGAAYGHGWGAVYVLAGAQAGAMVAFGIARFVGRETVQAWFGGRLSVGLIGSQRALMGIVFASRLLPFVSFDIVSYAAGLTVLSFWRFAVATMAGIAPSSFLLAHVGMEMGSGDTDRMLLAGLALGALTLLPVLVRQIRRRRLATLGSGRELPQVPRDANMPAADGGPAPRKPDLQ